MTARPLLLPVGAVAIVAFALGAWIFRGKSPASSTASASSPKTTVNATPRTSLSASSTAVTASDVDAKREHLLALRAKLPASLEQLLQALTDLGKTNPDLAINLAHELGRTEREKAAWVTNVMQQWADRDPSAAWQWLRQLGNDRMQDLAFGELGSLVLGTMATRDPQLVVSHLDVLLRQGNASESLSTPVSLHLGLAALVEHGKPDLAKSVLDAWTRDPAQLKLEAAAFETVAAAFAKTQPRETGDWLRSLPASEERNAAFAAFTAVWAERDPRAALQWAETIPAESGRHAAIQRTVSDWIEGHPDHVSAWLGDYLSRMPAGPDADRLVETVINVSPTLRAAPESALPWVNLISDPARRIDYHEQIALRWSEQNPSAALAFVAQSQLLPPERKAAVAQKIQIAQLAARPRG